MQIIRFTAMPITQFGSAFAMTHVLRTRDGVQAGIAQLPPGGRIGRHAAAANQLLLVIAGSGSVSGVDGVRVDIVAGDAAFWTEGEAHETSSGDGLTALVLEGPGVRPAALLPKS